MLSENGISTEYVSYNGLALTGYDTSGEQAEHYYYGTSLLAAELCVNTTENKNSTTLYYYIKNSHGDVIGLSDNDGTLTETYTYDAFCTLTEIQSLNENGILTETETAFSRFLYAGEQYDNITGLYYLRARRYDTTIGRFTQEDTYLGDGRNLYVYVGNNPLRYVDPSGHNTAVVYLDDDFNLFDEMLGALGIGGASSGGQSINSVISGIENKVSSVYNAYTRVTTQISEGVNKVITTPSVQGGWELSSNVISSYYNPTLIGVSVDGSFSVPSLAIDSQTFSNALDEVNFGYVAFSAGTGSATASSGGVNNGKCGSGGSRRNDDDESGSSSVKIQFPENPDDFNPEGLRKIGPFETKNGKVIKWLDENNKAVYEWDEDLTYGSHYHVIGEDGNTRLPNSAGETHFYPGDIFEK